MTVEDVERSPAAEPQPASRGAARGWLVAMGLLLAVAGIAAGALDVAGSLARQTEHTSATFADVRVVDVDVSAESVQVSAGSGDVVRLDRTVSWSLGRPHDSARVVDGRLVVRSSCPWSFGRGCSGTLRLAVPPSTQVRVHSSAGAVSVSGLDGVLDLSSSAGDVRGSALRSSDVTAESSGGEVRLGFATAPSAVTATSSAGEVAVLVPSDGTGYRVDADSSAGSMRVAVRTDSTSPRRIHARSSGGSVTVAYTP